MNRKQSRSTGSASILIKFSKIDLVRNAYGSKFTLVKGIFFPITLSPNQRSNKEMYVISLKGDKSLTNRVSI
jgi:hypothetical protein